MTITCEFPIEVTSEDINDIMCSAMEGGVTTLWVHQFEAKEGTWNSQFPSEHVGNGGTVIFHLGKDGDFEVTKQTLIDGFAKYIHTTNNLNFLYFDGRTIKVDTGQIDAIVADNIIQLGLFNSIEFS